jgi:hypothetical protein
MFTKRSECSNCGHSAVCAYKSRYRDFADEIQRATERGGVTQERDVFFAMAECRQWTPITQNIRAKNELLGNTREM